VAAVPRTPSIAQQVLQSSIASRQALQAQIVSRLGTLHGRAQGDYQLCDKEIALIQQQLAAVIAAGG
jgi:hypothetical protein